MFLSGATSKKRFLNISTQTLDDLKEKITKKIKAIPIEMYRKVSKNFRNRFQQCIAADSNHLSDIIFKT